MPDQELKDAIKEVANNLGHYLEAAKYQAEIKKNQYNEYLKEGFTKEQVLFLVHDNLKA